MKEQKRGTRTTEAIPDILARVSRGESLVKACEANKIVHSTFLERCAKDSKLADDYARARASGADYEFEGMQDLESQVLSGKLDPQAFRVAMDARKWRLARKSPKKYGDRSTLEHVGEDGGPVKFEGTIRVIRGDTADRD